MPAKQSLNLPNHEDATIALALDTINIGKQALVFVNSKRSAEKTAEDIALYLKKANLVEKEHVVMYSQFADQVLHELSTPTKQCERLALCLKSGIAFHHAGLTSNQRQLIETEFRNTKIKIICSTPTLAMGIDLPAYRAVLKDLRRYSGFGMTWIPVLEYLQMAGRAGRPKFDNKGEAIAISKNEAERDELYDRYICGVPEDIQSKLAVEPVLRTYVLSLIATEFVRNKEQLLDFFSRTFWAYQYGDMERLTMIIDKVLTLLEEFEFIKIQSTKDFVSADELEDENINKISATLIGKRVAELYIDPLTAFKLMTNLHRAAKVQMQSLKNKNTHYSLGDFSYLQMISNTLEMRPLLSVRASEYELIQQEMLKYEPYLLEKVPSMYEDEYDMFLESIKTSLMFLDWVNETQEKDLLEKYNVRPGEVYGNIESADWLLYSAEELARLLQFQVLLKDIIKLRIRLKYGAKEELLALLQLKQIGRVRARRLFSNRIRDIADLRKTDLSTLSQILGKNIALNIKEQLGENISAVPENKRKGQINLGDYKG
ncbi:hypothetical protein HYU06_05225 [Candidatus Woesearchaeota archaeon]|nr:hypothetical protein [Candidatus Woesearchaeota archaeon]